MKISQFFPRLLSAGILSLAIGTLNIQVAQGQNSVKLLSTNCLSTSASSWGAENQDISIGGKVYTATMYMWTGSRFSCTFRDPNSAPKFSTLKLGFGIPDNSNNPDMTLSVYLDGNKVGSRTFSRGEGQTWTIDVTKARRVDLELTCPSSSCNGGVKFFTAALERIPNFPGRLN